MKNQVDVTEALKRLMENNLDEQAVQVLQETLINNRSQIFDTYLTGFLVERCVREIFPKQFHGSASEKEGSKLFWEIKNFEQEVVLTISHTVITTWLWTKLKMAAEKSVADFFKSLYQWEEK